MSPERKKSRGFAKHIRKEKALNRRSQLPPPVNQVVDDPYKAELREISSKLLYDSIENPVGLAKLKIKRIFLQKRLGEIDEAQMKEELKAYLSYVERVQPYTFGELMQEVEPRITVIAQIRRQVFPEETRLGFRQLKP